MMPRGAVIGCGAVVGGLAAPAVDCVLGMIAATVIATIAVVGFCLGWWLRRRELRALGIGATVACLVLARATLGSPPPGSAIALPIDTSGSWTASIETVSSPRDGRRPAIVVLDGDPTLRVAASLPLVPEVSPSMTVGIDGRLEDLPEGPYGDYLRRIEVIATLEGRAIRIESVTTDDPAGWLERARQAAGEALDRAISEPAAGLASGIVVGLRDHVDRDLAADFTTVGASHVVAISGWNIAIVTATVMALARGVRRRRRVALAIATIVAYTLFAGASASVVRAAAMAAVALLARESGRPALAGAALGWAVAILVITDPAMVADPGFQLSVLGTAGLIVWADPLEGRLRRSFGGRLPGSLAESLAVSLAAQAATLPVVLATFGRLATVAPLVNLLVVPLVPPAMAGSVLALIGGFATMIGAPDVVAVILGAPAWALLSVLIGIVRAGAAIPGASIDLGSPFDTAAGVLAATGLMIGWHGRRLFRRVLPNPPPPTAAGRQAPADRPSSSWRRRLPAVGATGLAVAVIVAGSAALALPDGSLRIAVLDVGQGDAILLQGPRGGRLLIDGGPDPGRLRLRLDERLPPWDRRLDAVILSHPHEDHVAGLLALVARYQVGRLYEPGMRGRGPGYAAWSEALDRAGLGRERLVAGDRLTFDGLGLRVLWPDRGSVPPEPTDDGTQVNNVSVVLLGTIGSQRFLLTGDIEEAIDPILLDRGVPRVDVLKVAHHGSRTSSTEAFLARARPSLAIVSAGRRNPYGHPTKATIGRLEASGAEVLRTDLDGSVTVRLDGRSIAHGTAVARAAQPDDGSAGPSGPLRSAGIGCLIPRAASSSALGWATDGRKELDGYHRPRDGGPFSSPTIDRTSGLERPGPALCEPRRTPLGRARTPR